LVLRNRRLDENKNLDLLEESKVYVVEMDLSDNKFGALTEEIMGLSNLRVLKLDNNCIRKLPAILFE
jgi:Leucine-rich repeat (LRR) protein